VGCRFVVLIKKDGKTGFYIHWDRVGVSL